MNAKDVMTKKLLMIDKNATLEAAIKLMDKHSISRLLVKDDSKIEGIITEEDIGGRLITGRERKIKLDQLHVASAMTDYLRVVSMESSIRDVAEIMIKFGISSVVVEEGGEIVGLVTKADLMEALVESKKKIKDFYTKEPVLASLGGTVVHARKMMLDHGVHRLPVTDGGMLVGILTERDIAKGLKSFRKALDKYHHPDLTRLLVDDVMTRDPVVVKPDAMVGEVVGVMEDKKISGVPVVGEEFGIITKTDLVRGIAEAKLP